MKLIAPKVDGQSVNASDYNPPVQEPQKLVLSSEQTLEESDNYQSAKAAAYYAAVGDYYQDTGTANNYILTNISPRQGIPVYATGEKVRFIATHTNTGACTVNVMSIGSTSLLNYDGGVLVGGEIQATKEIIIEYDGTNWRLCNGIYGNLFHNGDGLVVSNNGANPNTHIDFGVGRWPDSNRDFIINNLVAGFNKNMTTNWVAGTGNGGKASAISITPASFAYVFILSKPDGTFDAGIDTNINAVNLLADASPSGYIKWRRIWAIYFMPTTSYIRPFHQYGNICVFKEPINTASVDFSQTGVNPSLPSPYSWNMPVPSGIEIDTIINILSSMGGGANYFDIYAFNTNQSDLLPGGVGGSPIGQISASVYDRRQEFHFVPAHDATLLFRVNTANPSGIVQMNCLSYTDFRTD